MENSKKPATKNPDVTERKWTKQIIRRLATVMRDSNDAIIIQDIDGRITAWNRGAELMYGYSETEALGMDIDHLSPPDKVTEQKEFTRRLIEGETVTSFETQRVTKDGIILDVWLTVTKLVENPADSIVSTNRDITRPIGVALIERNITLRKRAEEALQRSEQSFKSISENAHDGIIVALRNGAYIFANRRATEITGYATNEILKVGIEGIARPDESLKLSERRKKILAGEDVPNQYDTVIIHKAGNAVPIEITSARTLWFGQVADIFVFRDITERKRAEEALHDSEKRFRIATESTSDCVWEWDIEKGSLDWFGDIDSLLGYRRDEFPRTIDAWRNAIHPEDHDKVMALLDKHFDNHTPYDAKYRVVKKDGSIAFWVDRGTALRDENGKAHKMVGSVKDITEQKKAEEKLRKSEEELRGIFESIGDAVTVTDLEGKITEINEATVSLWGYAGKEELIGRKANDFVAEEHRSRVVKDTEEVLIEGRVKGAVEFNFIRKDGSIFSGEARAAFLKDDSGKPVGFISVVRDITERKRVEETLRQRERDFSTMIENATDMIVRFDTDLRYVYCNRAVEQQLGIPTHTLIGKTGVEVVGSLEQAEFVSKALRKALKTGDEQEVEQCLPLPSGAKHFLTRIIPERDEQGRIESLLAISRNITSRKRAEEELVKYKDHLEELVKERTVELDKAKIIAEKANKAKSDFLANMSHEIRTPLSAIIGFSELLYDEVSGPLNDNQKKYLGYVTSSGQHLLSLINDILDLSKVEAGKMELLPTSFSMSDLLKTSFSFIAEKALQHNIRLLSEISADVDMIEADERKVKQILYNLLSNAVKFTPDGETITVGADISSSDSVDIPIKMRKGLPDTKYVLVRVKDTGIGIAKKDQSKLFTEFQQIEEPYSKKYEGTGLGLALSKKLVTLHGGKIWFESKGKGKGCTFYFILPLKILPKA